MNKEVSCFNTRGVLDYVKDQNPAVYSALIHKLDPEIDALPDPEKFLRDPHNWISSAVAAELFRRAKVLLNDELAPMKIARFVVENTALGYRGILIKAFWSNKKALRHLQKINEKWNRNKRVELAELGLNKAVVRLHWDPHMEVSKDLCLYNQGNYIFISTIWGGTPMFLEERSCYFQGDPYCEYHLRWPFRNKIHEILSRFFSYRSVLMETIMEMEEDKRIIEEKYDEVRRLNQELNYKIKQLTAIQETGKAILSVLDLDRLLGVIMNILANVCQIRRALIMLVHPRRRQLEYLFAAGFSEGVPPEIQQYTVPLDRVSNIMARVANTGKSEYIPEVEHSSLNRENIVFMLGKPSSVYVVPLITRSRVIGIIATDSREAGGIPKEIRETLDIFAPQIAIAIENARLYQRLQIQMEELKTSQERLSRAEKLSFFGNLAARLAHEIKNPLVAIRTFLQMLPSKYDDDEFKKEFYPVALEETDRVNNLLTELLHLVKSPPPSFQLTDLHQLIDRMIRLVSAQIRVKGIRLEKRYAPALGPIPLDPEKMRQVILNLLANAIEYTPPGGRIVVETAVLHSDTREPQVSFSVQDNGAGIPSEILPKIFDPYFTTKHKSSIHKGTGLGLFIVYQNVLEHRGRIEVESRVEEGTKFTVWLPSALSEGEGVVATPAGPEDTPEINRIEGETF